MYTWPIPFLVCLPLVLFPWGAEAKTGPRPDLVILDLRTERLETQKVPLRIKVTLRIGNSGAGTGSRAFVTQLSFRRRSSDAWTPLERFTVKGLGQGEAKRWVKIYDFPKGGTLSFRAEIDTGRVFSETVESNNIRVLTRTYDTGKPDLCVKDLNCSILQGVGSGELTLRVTWEVHNAGTGEVKIPFVTVFQASKDGGEFETIKRYMHRNLDVGGSLGFRKDLVYQGLRSIQFRVMTDEGRQTGDSNPHNNTLKGKVLRP